uniref:Ribosomal protein L5 n=1 Tax=Pleurocladia lacustris TaxID=246121 RepID=A0A1I9LW93_9PHAE|nr:ribosomal protein L5 [Pleurocladia lacustris]ANS57821.1 ribosomal protein L5 [Pleurocladia lacustris]ANS57863.1 ribosomal protein L5 [Pleurocladia lacustris]
MHSFQKHYYDIVQRDLILSENLSTVSMLSAPKKISLCLGGDSTNESYVISSLSALKIITGQTPYFTQQKPSKQKNMITREGVGGKLTMRGPKMYAFLYKLLFDVLPHIKQFEGLRVPAHKNIYCFVLKDIFAFQELVPLFPYFEDLSSLQCQIHFTTKTKYEALVLGSSLQICFLSSKN